MTFVYEDACAIWETIAAEHRECAMREHQAHMTQYAAAEFTCPVAAGVIQATLAAGAQTEPRGDWQRWRAGGAGLFAMDLPVETPHWLLPTLTREGYRLWVLDALKTLGELAEVGRRKSYWAAPPLVQICSVDLKKGSFLKAEATESELVKAIARAAKSCPRATSNS